MERYVVKNQKHLRCGITTGSCAAAAADAAASFLLLGIRKENVSLLTPKNLIIEVPVSYVDGSVESGGKYEALGYCDERACFMTVKDSGDDPDVTDKSEIYVTIQRINDELFDERWFVSEEYTNLYLDGGIGVGRVTKPGLEQNIGQAAINAVPRKMIFGAVGAVCRQAEYEGRLLITVSIPNGVELAGKTFNPRLGICGGISVLGTSGIIEPMSEQSIVATIEAEIKQRVGQGEDKLIIAPGNYGQEYIEKYLAIDMNKSIKCSNYIGDTLDLAVSYGIRDILLVGDIGKLVKLAAGIMNTHSRVADARMEILAIHTVLSGGSKETAEKIMQCINTEQVLDELALCGLRDRVISGICDKIYDYVRHRVGDRVSIGVILFSKKYGYLGETQGSSKLVELFK